MPVPKRIANKRDKDQMRVWSDDQHPPIIKDYDADITEMKSDIRRNFQLAKDALYSAAAANTEIETHDQFRTLAWLDTTLLQLQAVNGALGIMHDPDNVWTKPLTNQDSAYHFSYICGDACHDEPCPIRMPNGISWMPEMVGDQFSELADDLWNNNETRGRAIGISVAPIVLQWNLKKSGQTVISGMGSLDEFVEDTDLMVRIRHEYRAYDASVDPDYGGDYPHGVKLITWVDFYGERTDTFTIDITIYSEHMLYDLESYTYIT